MIAKTLSCRLNSVLLGAALLLGLPLAATAQKAGGAGFADRGGMAARPPVEDIKPILRGPSVDTLATIRKRGTLRVGVALSEPMVMHDRNGQLIGYSVDLARKLADDLGVGADFVETSWSRIIPDLLDRQFDVIIAGLWATPTRALVVNYSSPTATEGVYLFASKSLAGGLRTLQDFNRPEVKIAVYAGSVQERLAKKHFPMATLVPVTGDESQLDPVLQGTAHAALIPTFAPQLIVQGAPDKLTLPVTEPLSATYTAMGVRKGDPDFLNYLNTWLAFHRDDGWIGDRAQYWITPANWLK